MKAWIMGITLRRKLIAGRNRRGSFEDVKPVRSSGVRWSDWISCETLRYNEWLLVFRLICTAPSQQNESAKRLAGGGVLP